MDSAGREVEIEPTGRQADWVGFCAAAPTWARRRRRMWLSWLVVVAGRIRGKRAARDRRERESTSAEELCARCFDVHVNSVWSGVAAELSELARDPSDLHYLGYEADLLGLHPELDVIQDDDDSINVA